MRYNGVMRWALVALMMVAGCQKASDATAEKRIPKPPPPPPVAPVEPPATLRIAVEVDGKEQPAVDAAKLKATPPDFSDSERRAWKLSTLLGPPATQPNAELAAIGSDNVAVVFPPARTPGDPEPSLMINRRGEIVAMLLSPKAPFPAFHGEGGRLGRPGDPVPHVTPIKLRVRTKPSH